MENHERLSVAIAASDLIYVAGTVLQANGAPKSWPFVEWGTSVAFEARKHVQDVHGIQIELDWEEEFAAAARHGSKFFDGRRDQVRTVAAGFVELAAGTHLSFFPPDREGGPLFDFLRNDLSVVLHDKNIVLTNVTGHFMVGLPPDRAARLETIGDHVRTLSIGLGQLTSSMTSARLDEIREHGNSQEVELTWWDAKMSRLIPASFGGELEAPLAFSVMSIMSSLQSARLWARVECCGACSAAALKHRFVVSHHAARSLTELAAHLGASASARLIDAANTPGAAVLTSPAFRRLRNGWLHLGLGDIASEIEGEPTVLSHVPAYTGLDVHALTMLVDRYLDDTSLCLNQWLLTPGRDGKDVFAHLTAPPSN